MGFSYINNLLTKSGGDGATHIVTYVQYGSELNIELKYESQRLTDDMKISGSLKGSLSASSLKIEAELTGNIDSTDTSRLNDTSIKITGKGVKNLPAVNSVNSLKSLLNEIQEKPEEYFKPVVISFDAVPINQIFDIDRAVFLQQISDRIIDGVYNLKVGLRSSA